jgi:putative DNA primase/helicase
MNLTLLIAGNAEVLDASNTTIKSGGTHALEFTEPSVVPVFARSDNELAQIARSRPPEEVPLPESKPARFLYPRTDAGNAELFAALNGKRLRYDHQRKRWLVWNRHWWTEDKKGTVQLFAKAAARNRRKRSEDIEDDDQRRYEAKWAFNSESRHRLDSMLALARAEPELATTGGNWDSDPWLLGVANGVLDLRTGILRDGKPEEHITLHTNIPFDPDAQCPQYEKFIMDISGGDKELADYIQRCLGYSLTGETSEQCMFDCYGEGANGKSTLIETIRYVLGDYAYNAPFATFEKKARSGIPNDVAAMAGRRFISAGETDEGVRLNESRMKALTGGDAIAARKLYGEWFEFAMRGKIWLAFNHKPEIVDDSHGMWRRIRLIPFTRKFDANSADKHLKEKLQAEAAGILAWLVRGCLDWQRRELGEPPIVTQATEAYRAESDTVGSFISDCCVIGPNESVSSRKLLDKYENWAAENGVEKMSRRIVSRRLESRGFKRAREGHERNRVFSGIGLKDDDPLD